MSIYTRNLKALQATDPFKKFFDYKDLMVDVTNELQTLTNQRLDVEQLQRLQKKLGFEHMFQDLATEIVDKNAWFERGMASFITRLSSPDSLESIENIRFMQVQNIFDLGPELLATLEVYFTSIFQQP